MAVAQQHHFARSWVEFKACCEDLLNQKEIAERLIGTDVPMRSRDRIQTLLRLLSQLHAETTRIQDRALAVLWLTSFLIVICLVAIPFGPFINELVFLLV